MSTKKALVLSGGNIKGAFQAGAIAEIFSQFRSFEPNILVGTSIGAVNAGFLADRAGKSYKNSGAVNWLELGESLQRFWRDKVTGPECIIDKKSKWRLFWDVKHKKFAGLVGIDPAIQMIRKNISLANVRASANSGLEIRVATVNVASGQSKLAGPSSDSFIEYIVASAVMPMIMPLVEIGHGSFYTDGGIRDVAPVRAAIDDFKADEIICVLCQPEVLNSTTFLPGNALALAQRFMDIIINETVNNDIEYLKMRSDLLARNPPPKRREVTVRIVRPSDSIDVDMESFTSEDITRMIATGREAASAVSTRSVHVFTVP